MITEIDTCPECGAAQHNGLDCWHMLGEIISMEYANPELLKKHFLTVASYNLQHPSQFTDEAIHGLRISLRNYLSGREGISQIRQKNASTNEGSRRVKKPELERVIVPRQWPMTIADVYLSGEPQGVASRVQRWAESITAS